MTPSTREAGGGGEKNEKTFHNKSSIVTVGDKGVLCFRRERESVCLCLGVFVWVRSWVKREERDRDRYGETSNRESTNLLFSSRRISIERARRIRGLNAP